MKEGSGVFYKNTKEDKTKKELQHKENYIKLLKARIDILERQVEYYKNEL